jgi:hypothetical protein
MAQQEIAFQLRIHQGRVNEVIKHGKWLTADPQSEEASTKSKAKSFNSAQLSTDGSLKASGK